MYRDGKLDEEGKSGVRPAKAKRATSGRTTCEEASSMAARVWNRIEREGAWSAVEQVGRGEGETDSREWWGRVRVDRKAASRYTLSKYMVMDWPGRSNKSTQF